MKKFCMIALLILLAGCSSPAAENPTAAPTEVRGYRYGCT